MKNFFISPPLLVLVSFYINAYEPVSANEMNLSGTYIAQDSCDFFLQEYNFKNKLENETSGKEDYLPLPPFQGKGKDIKILLSHLTVPKNNMLKITQLNKKHLTIEYVDNSEKISVLEIEPVYSTYINIDLNSQGDSVNVKYTSSGGIFGKIAGDNYAGNWTFNKIQNSILVNYDYSHTFSYLYPATKKRTGQCVLTTAD